MPKAQRVIIRLDGRCKVYYTLRHVLIFKSYDMSTIIINVLNFIDHYDKVKPILNFNNFKNLILSKTSLLR